VSYRYELKFVLNETSLSGAIKWMRLYTTAKKAYDERRVNSLYFDDLSFSGVRDNLAGISQRNKKRLRWYGNNKTSNPIFEVKTRNGRLGSKLSYPISSLEGVLFSEKVKDIALKCRNEITYKYNIVLDHYLSPVLLVKYDREYFETFDGIRITIDKQIKFSDVHLNHNLCEVGFIPYSHSIMEIKFEPYMKDIVSKMIRPLHITPKRHSKYLVGLSKLGYSVYI
jgi:hypothetical protein